MEIKINKMLLQLCFLFGGYTLLLFQNPVAQSGKSDKWLY